MSDAETKSDVEEAKTDETKWAIGQRVQVQDTNDLEKWTKAKIVRVHRNGNVTVKYSTGEKESNVAPKRLKQKQESKSVEKEDTSETPKRRQKDKQARWHKQERVLFNVDGVQKTGKLIAVRKDDCDIEHDSDADHISNNVNLDEIQALRWWHRLYVPKTRFKIQAKVRYIDRKGRSHDGTIIKRHGDNTYDIRHLSDNETEIENVSIQDIESLSVWHQFATRIGQHLSHGFLRVGSLVQFQREGSSWKDGTVKKVHADGKYAIEYCDSETEELQVVKIPSASIRRKLLPFTGLGLASSLELHDGMRVEVTCNKDDRELIKLGEIVRTHSDETKCIRFDDGKIEKHVLPSFDSNFQGIFNSAKVDVTVETNTAFRCVQPKSGTIAWIHQDFSSVVLAISDEDDEKTMNFCPDIPVEALRLHGYDLSLEGFTYAV
ncbi:hypothetical protein Ae201684P_022336 [Aphanomyces euteiches]|nr:hypothetical protein Ae201684P_022336 [Aphanomyces euteiches]